MLENLIQKTLFEYSYLSIYFIVFLYFLVLYFIVGPLFLKVCEVLYKKGYLNKIIDKNIPVKQRNFELKHSFKSIIVFGFSAFPIIYLVRENFITLLPDTIINTLLGLLFLNIWNEIHFFIVHRLMHTPFFLKNVHKVHHKSHIPSVFSVYSFHWVEALLLSTVPIIFVLVVPLSSIAIAIYPFTSIIINYAGHCNYRFGNGTGSQWKLFGTYHNEHHYKFKQNFGFGSHLLDKLYQLISKNKP